jgi:hypothetical protein
MYCFEFGGRSTILGFCKSMEKKEIDESMVVLQIDGEEERNKNKRKK